MNIWVWYVKNITNLLIFYTDAFSFRIKLINMYIKYNISYVGAEKFVCKIS